MKRIYLFSILIVLFSCNSNAQNKLLNEEEIVRDLNKNLTNYSLHEIAFVLPELLSVIENDSSLWRKKMSQSFKKTLKEETIHFRTLELMFLKKMVKKKPSFIKDYPLASKLILSTEIPRIDLYNTYSIPFKGYVVYPEQADDVCIITLLVAEDCKFFDDIEDDKVSSYHYNNWIEYGFEEFRYYPGTQDKVKEEINNRIIKHLLKETNCPESILVKKALVLMRKYIKD